MTLDQVQPGARAQITAIDWSHLAADDATRLRALGVDIGAKVTVMHRGVFGGHDPLAIRLGAMTIAIRLVHASAMEVELL